MEKKEFNSFLVKSLDEVRYLIENVKKNIIIYKTQKGYCVAFTDYQTWRESNRKGYAEKGYSFPNAVAYSQYAYNNNGFGSNATITANAKKALKEGGIAFNRIDNEILIYCENDKLIFEKMKKIFYDCYEHFKSCTALENTCREEYSLAELKDLKWDKFKKFIEEK